MDSDKYNFVFVCLVNICRYPDLSSVLKTSFECKITDLCQGFRQCDIRQQTVHERTVSNTLRSWSERAFLYLIVGHRELAHR